MSLIKFTYRPSHRINAIKTIREAFAKVTPEGCGLKEALDMVNLGSTVHHSHQTTDEQARTIAKVLRESGAFETVTSVDPLEEDTLPLFYEAPPGSHISWAKDHAQMLATRSCRSVCLYFNDKTYMFAPEEKP